MNTAEINPNNVDLRKLYLLEKPDYKTLSNILNHNIRFNHGDKQQSMMIRDKVTVLLYGGVGGTIKLNYGECIWLYKTVDNYLRTCVGMLKKLEVATNSEEYYYQAIQHRAMVDEVAKVSTVAFRLGKAVGTVN